MKMKYIFALVLTALLCGCENVPGDYQRDIINSLTFFKRHGVCFAVVSHPRASEGGLAVVPDRVCEENPEPPVIQNN